MAALKNNEIAKFKYDRVGRRTKLTSPNGAVTTYKYDQAGRLTAVNSTANTNGEIAKTATGGNKISSFLSRQHDSHFALSESSIVLGWRWWSIEASGSFSRWNRKLTVLTKSDGNTSLHEGLHYYDSVMLLAFTEKNLKIGHLRWTLLLILVLILTVLLKIYPQQQIKIGV